MLLKIKKKKARELIMGEMCPSPFHKDVMIQRGTPNYNEGITNAKETSVQPLTRKWGMGV